MDWWNNNADIKKFEKITDLDEKIFYLKRQIKALYDMKDGYAGEFMLKFMSDEGFPETELIEYERQFEMHVFLLKSKLNYYIDFKKEQSQSQPAPAKKATNSFNSTLTNQQLEKLHRWLIDGKYIASDTSIEALRDVFICQPLSNIQNPIVWIKTALNKSLNKAALIELIQLLFDFGFVPEPESLSQKKRGGLMFDILTGCFVDSTGKSLLFSVSNKSKSAYYNDIKDFITTL
jgi:hypothetical protein